MEKKVCLLGKDRVDLSIVLEKDESYKVRDRNGIFSLTFFKNPQLVRGVSSICEDGHHVLFADYDGVDVSVVEKDADILRSLFDVSPIFIVESSLEDGVGSYHLICLQKFSIDE